MTSRGNATRAASAAPPRFGFWVPVGIGRGLYLLRNSSEPNHLSTIPSSGDTK